MKRILMGIVVLVLLLGYLEAPSFAAYPERNLEGIICWGSGGGTDNTSRAVTPYAEQELGKKIILQNRPGAAGAVGSMYVYNKPADGYTLLYGAETTNTYKVLGVCNVDYVDDFDPIMLFTFGVDIICVNPNTPYKTLQELVDAGKNQPDTIKLATTGPGGMPFVLNALMSKANGTKFLTVNFDGEGPALAAILGGHVDLLPLSSITAGAVDMIKAGKLRALAVVNDKRLDVLPDVPAIVEMYPEYGKYLPLGHWFGVFVKKGTPQGVIDTLTTAFTKAVNHPKFEEYVERLNGIKLGLSGEKAKEFMSKGRSTVSWALYEAGSAKFSPAEFGIPKP